MTKHSVKSVKFVFSLLWAISCVSVQAQTSKQEEDQPIKEVCDFLQQCGVYFIATADGDQPRVRPFGTAVVYENRLYIQTGKRKRVAKQIIANPKIEICAYNQSKGQWLRIEATAVPDERVETKQFILDRYPSLKSMYSATDDNTFALYLQNVTATFSSFSEKERVVRF